MDLETSAGGNFDWQVTACAAEPKIRRGSQRWSGMVQLQSGHLLDSADCGRMIMNRQTSRRLYANLNPNFN